MDHKSKADKYSLKDMNYISGPSLSSHIMDIPEKNAGFELPQKIGHYSVDVNKKTNSRDVRFDESNLSYLKLPPSLTNVDFDLTQDYNENVNWSNTGNDTLKDFLKWITLNLDLVSKSSNPHKPLDFDFVCYRGVMTKIMTAPFVSYKWLIGASKFRETIYLYLYPQQNDFPQSNLFIFGGHRFEKFITESDSSNEANNFVQHEYACVVKSKLKATSHPTISLLYAAEMDCLDTDKTDSSKLENFVEIKTTRKITSEHQNRNMLKFKMIQWWAQSYLVGIKKIICGYKYDDHKIKEIAELDLNDISYRCSPFWSKRQCLNFLHNFLYHIQNIMKNENDPFKVYLFNNEIRNVISCQQLIISGPFSIIPQWYIDEINRARKPS